MSGLPALRGFDYQVTVTLDQLLTRLGRPGHLVARPEGKDDLVFRGNEDTPIVYVQIKKPREDQYGRPKTKEWSIPDICAHLLPDAMERLADNSHHQEFLLGDPLSAASARLFAPLSTPASAPCTEYWQAVHLLARNRSKVTSQASTTKDKAILDRWQPDVPDDTSDALNNLAMAFSSEAKSRGAGDIVLKDYRQELTVDPRRLASGKSSERDAASRA